MSTLMGAGNTHGRVGFATFAVTLVMILLFRGSPHVDSTSNVSSKGGMMSSSLRMPGPPAFKPVVAASTVECVVPAPVVISSAVIVGEEVEAEDTIGSISNKEVSLVVVVPEPPVWPSDAILWSIDGRQLNRLTLDALWAWSPEKLTIVSGDTIRDGAPYICDDDYGMGLKRGCRFESSALRSPARIFAKLRHHYPEARTLVKKAGVKHVFLHGGGDEPLNEEQTNVRGEICYRYSLRNTSSIVVFMIGLLTYDAFTSLLHAFDFYYFSHTHPPHLPHQDLSTDTNLLGFFATNIPRMVNPDPRIHGIPLGVERTLSPRGMYPGMYLKQRTGWNLAAKLCWAPVFALDAAAAAAAADTTSTAAAVPVAVGDTSSDASSITPPILYMNFRTETNPGVRTAAQAAFNGKSWVKDHVNAGDAVDLLPPGGGVKEAELEAALRVLWKKHAVITSAPWFRAACGSGPILPRGLDPALISELALPGYPLFLKAMASSPFVLAPEGNGLPTHRAWESIYVGTIAVIKEAGAMMDSQYRGLPVMMISDWDEVTPLSLSCFSVELFVKSLGFPVGGVGKAGGGLYPTKYTTSTASMEDEGWAVTEEAITEMLNTLDSTGTLSKICSKTISVYAKKHENTHTGFLSLDSLDYKWWDQFIERRTNQLLG
jgi:hypothetical protein